MPLRLTIENVPSLPDGGPISYSVSGKRGFDIGRDQYLDWVLPDPNRVISGKHCEVRFRDGAYWLRDVSTNGTFVNRSERRLQEQHRLRSGDRIEIGHYIINVEVEGEEEGGEETDAVSPASGDVWDGGGAAAPPVDPRSLRPANIARPLQSVDVLDWVAAIPEPVRTAPPPAEYGPAPNYNAVPPPAYAPPPPAPASFSPPSAAPPTDNIWDSAPVAKSSPGWEAPPPEPLPAASPQPAPVPERVAPVAPVPPMPGPPGAGPARALPRAEPAAFAPAEPAAPPPPVEPLPAYQAPPAPPRAPEPSFAPPPPAPVPPPSYAPAPPREASSGASGAEFIRRFAKGAGIPPESIAARDAGELAELLGSLMNIVAGNVGQLLVARAESKGAMRSANQTLIQAADNNPLRFSPTAEDALAIMFGRPTKSYLDAQRAFEQSFLQLKSHQVDSFAAIQAAIQQLVADLDPKEIEKAVDAQKGGLMFANKKARLWEEFTLRWRLKTGAHETGLLGAFMQFFGEAYDKRKR